jgi:hypothetical protein
MVANLFRVIADIARDRCHQKNRYSRDAAPKAHNAGLRCMPKSPELPKNPNWKIKPCHHRTQMNTEEIRTSGHRVIGTSEKPP